MSTMLLALPFLPADHIPREFEELTRRARSPSLRALLSYIEKSWVNGAVAPPESWSVFGQPIRTNNDTEGWHRRLNGRAPQRTPPMYQLIQYLNEEAKLLSLQMWLVSEKKLKKIQRKQYRTIQAKIFALWTKFNEGNITTAEFLRACGHIYAPM